MFHLAGICSLPWFCGFSFIRKCCFPTGLQGPLQVGKMFNPLYSILLSQRSQPTCHMPWTEGSGSSIYLPLASFDYGFSNDWIGGGIGVLPEMFFKTYLHLICGEDFIELLSPKKWNTNFSFAGPLGWRWREGGRERDFPKSCHKCHKCIHTRLYRRMAPGFTSSVSPTLGETSRNSWLPPQKPRWRPPFCSQLSWFHHWDLNDLYSHQQCGF